MVSERYVFSCERWSQHLNTVYYGEFCYVIFSNTRTNVSRDFQTPRNLWKLLISSVKNLSLRDDGFIRKCPQRGFIRMVRGDFIYRPKRRDQYISSASCNRTITENRGSMVFRKISVPRSKYCLEFSIAWGRLNLSKWSLHSCTTLIY